jgi:predicted metal-dependent hydrolase
MELEYQLIRSRKRKKTLSLKITGTGAIIIQAPYHTPAGEIAAFFERKKPWLQEKLKQRQAYSTSPSSRSLKAGEQILFLGVPYPLVVDDYGSQMELFTLKPHQFILNGRVFHHGKTLLRTWYEAQAKAYLSGRTDYYCRVWGLHAEGIRISNAISRWGSCSSRNILSFTWRLMMAPPDVIDYVVVHELAHIREKNHARSFWDLLSKMMPDYETQRTWLRKNGHVLHL